MGASKEARYPGEVIAVLKSEGQLFPVMEPGIRGRLKARRQTLTERIEEAVSLIADDPDQWIVWCGLNDEGRALHQALNGASVLVEGSMPDEKKLAASAALSLVASRLEK